MDVKESDQIIESLLFANPDPLSQYLLNQVASHFPLQENRN